METLNEQDLDLLTKIENRLITMRKRETSNTNSSMLIENMTDTIKHIHELRQFLQARFGMKVDEDIVPFKIGDS